MIVVLFKRSHLQEVDLFLSQIAPTAAGQVLLGQTCEVYTVEFCHMISERLEYAAHDTVASGMNLDTGLIAVSIGRIADSVGMDRPVVELYTVGYTLHIVLADIFVAPYVINLLLHILRMCQLGGEIAVVGKQKHTRSVAVETTHRVYALGACALHYIHHRQTAVGIIGCGDAILRLVEQDIAFALQSHDLVVEFHYIVVAYLCSEFGHDLTVDLNQTFLDKFVGLAARAYSGVGHELVKTDLFVGIGYRHFIFDALGTRHETLALRTVETTRTPLLLAVAIRALTLLAVVISALTVIVVAALTGLIAAIALGTVIVGTLLIAALTVIVVAALTVVIVRTVVVGTLLVALTGLIAALLS